MAVVRLEGCCAPDNFIMESGRTTSLTLQSKDHQHVYHLLNNCSLGHSNHGLDSYMSLRVRILLPLACNIICSYLEASDLS